MPESSANITSAPESCPLRIAISSDGEVQARPSFPRWTACVRANLNWVRSWLEAWCLDPATLHHLPSRILKQSKHLWVQIWTPPQFLDVSVCSKHTHYGWRPVCALASLATWRASNAFLQACRFQQLGLRTPAPLGVAQCWRKDGLHQLLLTEARQGESLLNWIRTRSDDTESRNPSTRHLINDLARQLRVLHQQRFDHRDLKVTNLLVEETASGPTCWLLDLDTVWRWPLTMPTSRKVQNLARLVASLEEKHTLSRTSWLRGLRAYLGIESRHWKWWWRAIAKRASGKIVASRYLAQLIHAEANPFPAEVSSKQSLCREFSSKISLLWVWLCGLVLLLCLLPGCASTNKQDKVSLPSRHAVRSKQLIVLSDFQLPDDHPLIKDLNDLRGKVASTLQLPVQKEDVNVYLFSDELAYHQYLQATHPGLPSRRAYFIATPKELAVYTYWGERVQEDLRHEYTHGLLHASLQAVPLWLDEGLAEYFEVIGPGTGTLQFNYVEWLTQAMQNGWQPDMERLERIEQVSQMQRAEYREAWAWVHFLLHSSPETRQVLLGYLNDLRSRSSPTPISERLADEIPANKERFLSYLAGLNTRHMSVNQASGSEVIDR